MAVTWKRIEDGVYKRTGADGRPIYRAVRQAGKREDGGYAQEVKTFNGAKIANALREARNWRAEGTFKQATGPRVANTAANQTLRQAYEVLRADPDDPPAAWTVKLDGYLLSALDEADPRLLDRKLKDIDSRGLRTALSKIKAPSMRDKSRKLVGRVFNFHEVTPNPAAKPPKKRTRAARMAQAKTKLRYLDDGDVERLIVAVPDRYKALVRLLWRVGLRPGEALALTVGQYDPDTRILTIDRGVNKGVLGPTKTGRTRRPVLPGAIASELERHITEFGDWSDREALVFSTESGTMLDADNWRKREFEPAARAAGLDGATPYDLRHTACTNAVAAGVDLASVAEMVGNGVDVLARVYVHYSEQRGREAAERLDALILEGAVG